MLIAHISGRTGIRLPVGAREFSRHQLFHIASGADTTSCALDIGVLTPGIKEASDVNLD